MQTRTHAPPPHSHTLTDAVEDEARLCRDLDEEVSELREECEEGRVERVAHYEEQLVEWKTYMRARVGTDLRCHHDIMLVHHTEALMY